MLDHLPSHVAATNVCTLGSFGGTDCQYHYNDTIPEVMHLLLEVMCVEMYSPSCAQALFSETVTQTKWGIVLI